MLTQYRHARVYIWSELKSHSVRGKCICITGRVTCNDNWTSLWLLEICYFKLDFCTPHKKLQVWETCSKLVIAIAHLCFVMNKVCNNAFKSLKHPSYSSSFTYRQISIAISAKWNCRFTESAKKLRPLLLQILTFVSASLIVFHKEWIDNIKTLNAVVFSCITLVVHAVCILIGLYEALHEKIGRFTVSSITELTILFEDCMLRQHKWREILKTEVEKLYGLLDYTIFESSLAYSHLIALLLFSNGQCYASNGNGSALF